MWEIEFEPTDNTPTNTLTRIDHIAQSMTPDEMLSWRLFYLSLFDFETTPQVDVVDPAGIVESIALQDEAPNMRVCLNASETNRTLSSRFLNEFFGAGVQHLAFATDDIFASAKAINATGLEMLPIPENHYNDMEARLDIAPETLDGMRALGILYDEDDSGQFFQIYTRAFQERFFFEVVQHNGYASFGAPNAPIRHASQARLSRGLAMPRS